MRQLSTAAYQGKDLRQFDRRASVSTCTIERRVRELLLNAVVEQLVRGWVKGALGFAEYEIPSASVLEVNRKESGILVPGTPNRFVIAAPTRNTRQWI